MPRILYLDTFSGVSGDMLLGALLDAGLDLDALERGLRRLGVVGWRLERREVLRGPFRATRLRVLLDDDTPLEPPAPRAPTDHTHSHDHGDPHRHEHGHSHGHTHEHGHSHSHSHGHADHHEGQRDLRTIRALIEGAGLPARATARALAVFERIGRAEARCHGVSIDEVHFHEVGAVDSIVDIAGVCLALDLMDVDRVAASPMTLGSGFARGAHGTFPLPAPATIEILRGVPVRQRETPFELTTPTGAALAAELAESFGPMPPLEVQAVGYGAGNDRPGEVPNVLRVVLGEALQGAPGDAAGLERDRVVVLETNVDDMNPQWLGHVVDRLLAAGALDVSVTPILMKKGRPAHAVTVLARPGADAPLQDILFRETTTFGLRRQELDRVVLQRESIAVPTEWGEVRVKVGRRGDEVLSAEPEYEDLRRAAASSGRPLKELQRLVMERFHAQGGTRRSSS